MPTSVRVGCYDFSVSVAGQVESMMRGEYGRMVHPTCSIEICPGLCPQQLANTFVHEVIHAIHWVYGVNDDADEEHNTNQTANGLCAFIQDNPEAWAWVTNLLGSK